MPTYKITPVAKPRMTRADRWKKRKCVTKYWAFKDEVRELGITIPDGGSHITFVVPVPKSWSMKKKVAREGQPHQQRPDVDNFMKAIFDAVFEEDCHIWDARVTKVWGFDGEIVIESEEKPCSETG